MIQVVYACNDGYIDCLQLSILSILRRTKQNIHFYVLTQDFTRINPKFKALSNKNEKLLKQFVKKFNKNNDFTKIDTSSVYNKLLKKNKNENTKYSPFAYLRCLIDEVGLTGKVIYLDVDTMCCGDIKELNSINLKGKSIGGCKDYLAQYWHPKSKQYFNSGVLLIDIKKAKQVKLFDIARQLLYKKKFKLVDQTALFKAAQKTKSYIIFPRGFRYNTQQPKMLPNTLIKHFCATWINGRWQSIKQTDIKSVHKKLKIHTFDKDYEVWQKNKVN